MTVTDPRLGIDPQEDDSLQFGWVAFSGLLLLLLAVLNGIEGIAAIAESQVFGRGPMLIGDLQTWGWVLAAIAVAQLLAAPWVWMSVPVGRSVGIASAAINAVVQLLFLPAYPLWAIAILGLDLLVLYSLVVRAPARPA